jgi:hypothetical protein
MAQNSDGVEHRLDKLERSIEDLKCRCAAPARGQQDAWRWPVYLAFAILLLASLGLMGIIAVQSWQELHRTPSRLVAVHDASKTAHDQALADLKDAFDVYRDRVDNLQKLVALLIGLSSLYAVVLSRGGSRLGP